MLDEGRLELNTDRDVLSPRSKLEAECSSGSCNVVHR